ncbi:hypothetical protein ACNOYE_19405 [Nannocystaceae bacterium ST9]
MIGLRRALALLILSFFGLQFLVTGLLGPDELQAMYVGLALCYLTAFVAVAAEWFWGRWFAMGVGNFGTLFLLVLVKIGFEPLFVFFGVSHLLVTVCLMGEGMAAKYEYSEATAERWNFQEESIALMRRAVRSAGSTLPLLILYALAPRGEWLHLTVLAAAVAGFVGLVRAKTWGPIVLGLTGAVCLADGLGLLGAPTIGYLMLGPDVVPALYGRAGVFAGGLMLVMLPFMGPMFRWMRTSARA